MLEARRRADAVRRRCSTDSSIGTGSTIVTSPTRCSRSAPIAAARFPTARCVFDRYAEAHLRRGRALSGRIARRHGQRPARSTRRRIARRCSRCATRCAGSSASTADQPLAVLAAKFTEIQDVLPDLVDGRRGAAGHAPRSSSRIRRRRRTCTARPSAAIAEHLGRGMPTPISARAAHRRGRDRHDELDGRHRRAGAAACPRSSIGLPNNLSPFVRGRRHARRRRRRRDSASAASRSCMIAEVRQAFSPPAPRSPPIRAGLRRPGCRASGGRDSGAGGQPRRRRLTQSLEGS